MANEIILNLRNPIECVQSVFRVCSECLQSVFTGCSEGVQRVFRVCSEFDQSVLRVRSECVQSMFRVCSILKSCHHLAHLMSQFLAFFMPESFAPLARCVCLSTPGQSVAWSKSVKRIIKSHVSSLSA